MDQDAVYNERLKLFATWLNALGSGIVITGVFAPLIAVTLGLSTAADVPPVNFVLSSVIWLLSGFALNWLARRSLRSLR
ncbi:hypothetical protein [Pelagibacterium lentulum]|uniref:Uncharacterized protein n=1 Tax=Pelagibacterium lentulum TaxID=2029865 RepID=A0A916RD91_9HYPH|nr:hypothetical protein [Pelagibacterium lentulum]GGA51861.1 hypothetical protein GCM10011499_22380 [Pelagibacterium lentulum]